MRHWERFAALGPARPLPTAVVSEAPDARPALLEFLDRHRKQLVQLFKRPVEIAEAAPREVHVALLIQTSAPSRKTLRFGPLRAQSRRTHAAGFSCSWVPPSPEDWLASGRPGTESLATCSFGLLGSRWLGRWDVSYPRVRINAIPIGKIFLYTRIDRGFSAAGAWQVDAKKPAQGGHGTYL